MNGKLLDAGLVIVWLGSFFIVAMVHPGAANFVIAWIGAVLLGWYSSLVRYDPKTGALRGPWRPRQPLGSWEASVSVMPVGALVLVGACFVPGEWASRVGSRTRTVVLARMGLSSGPQAWRDADQSALAAAAPAAGVWITTSRPSS